MKEFQQLMLTDDNSIITEKQRDFKQLHNEILIYGQAFADNLINFAVKLHQMKETELYKEAGFDTFEDYTEKACNIKSRQAYNYLSIVDKLPTDYIKANATLGVSKLAMIASLSADQREELENAVDINDISSRELNDEIKRIKDEAQVKIDDLNDQLKEKEDLICDLRKVKPNDKELKKAQEEAAAAKKEADKAKAALEKAQAAADEAKKALEEKKVETITDPKLEKEIEELTADLQYAKEELKKAKERAEILANQSVQKFMVQFDNLKTTANAIKLTLSEMKAEDKIKFSGALKKAYEMLIQGIEGV